MLIFSHLHLLMPKILRRSPHSCGVLVEDPPCLPFSWLLSPKACIFDGANSPWTSFPEMVNHVSISESLHTDKRTWE